MCNKLSVIEIYRMVPILRQLIIFRTLSKINTDRIR